MKQYSITIFDKGEWGEFFVTERTNTRDPDNIKYSATWCCVSSYGVFGYIWIEMGCPFVEFIKQLEEDYLLGKISKKIFSEERYISQFAKAILKDWREGNLTLDAAHNAIRVMRELQGDYEDVVLVDAIYRSQDIGLDIEWLTDIDGKVWDNQAVQFIRRLWPKFVTNVIGEVTNAIANT